MMVAAARTGQRVTFRDNMSVVALFVLSFFCILKVMLMQFWRAPGIGRGG